MFQQVLGASNINNVRIDVDKNLILIGGVKLIKSKCVFKIKIIQNRIVGLQDCIIMIRLSKQ